jgi:hypothetical protein
LPFVKPLLNRRGDERADVLPVKGFYFLTGYLVLVADCFYSVFVFGNHGGIAKKTVYRYFHIHCPAKPHIRLTGFIYIKTIWVIPFFKACFVIRDCLMIYALCAIGVAV